MKRSLPCRARLSFRRPDDGIGALWGAVLWLLPYLVLTVLGSVSHTHGPGDESGFTVLVSHSQNVHTNHARRSGLLREAYSFWPCAIETGSMRVVI